MREAHHSALVAAATLEEEIEWLSCPLIQSQSETQTHSHGRDCRHRSRGCKRKHHQVWPEDCLAPYYEYNPPVRSLEPGGEEAATKDLNLGEPPELEMEVAYFLQGSAESLGEENMKVPSPKPPIEDLQKWVTWKAWTCETLSWWQELTMVPGVDNYKKLARKVWASFEILKRVSELCWVKNDHWALPALPCLCQKSFLLPPDSIFACWDIWEIPHEKTVAYMQALQFWAEKGNLRLLICLPEGNHACWWGV